MVVEVVVEVVEEEVVEAVDSAVEEVVGEEVLVGVVGCLVVQDNPAAHKNSKAKKCLLSRWDYTVDLRDLICGLEGRGSRDWARGLI